MKAQAGDVASIPVWILNADISRSALRLAGLLSLYNSKTGDTFPSVPRLAKELGISDRMVQLAKKELIDLGALRATKRTRPNGGNSSDDYMLMTLPPGEADFTRVGEADLTSVSLKERKEQSETSSPPGTAQQAAPAKRKAAKKTDPLWDVFDALLGEVQGRSERGRRNAALKELREIGVTPDDLRKAITAYRKNWPNVTLTETAVAANWSKLLPKAAQRKKHRCQFCTIEFATSARLGDHVDLVHWEEAQYA